MVTAAGLLTFGVIKLFTYYRHPRWVGMRVGMRDLFLWSFLMAAAHGAGLMVAPTLLEIAGSRGDLQTWLSSGAGVLMGVGLHTLSMLVVMTAAAAIVYRKLGLQILRQSWINFDLIWAVALLVVGLIALWLAVVSVAR
jgi:hypothetical protein